MTDRMKSYLLFPAVSMAAGGAAAAIVQNDTTFFSSLQKPFFSPPAVVFPIVWSILYLLMGISAARVSLVTGPQRDNGLAFFAVQLVINFFWPLLFFSLREYAAAAVWIVLLFAAAVSMTMAFSKADRAAALLQLPYLFWLLFALILNMAILLLN